MSMTATNPAEQVRKIRIYRNGDENFVGKEFVVNPRHVRTYDRFLQSVTSHVGLQEAARSVRTPRHGTVIRSLDELENNHDYVAVSYGRFKSIGYLNIQDRYFQRVRDSRRHRSDEVIKIVEHSPIRVSGRIRKVISDVVTIFVYCNGEDMTPARKVMLTFRVMQSWSFILSEINRNVHPQFGATRMLYTVDGAMLRHKSEIRNGGQYVAVGSRVQFKALDYGKYGKPTFTVSPRVPHGRVASETIGLTQGHRDKSWRRVGPEDGSSAESSSLPPLSTQSDPVTDKQRVRHMRRTRDPKLVYSDGRDVFHQRPIKLSRTPHATTTVDYDKDEGGVFKARSTRRETLDAAEVRETNDTRVDVPVDLRAAEEVEDEDDKPPDRQRKGKQSQAGSVQSKPKQQTAEYAYIDSRNGHQSDRTQRTPSPGPETPRHQPGGDQRVTSPAQSGAARTAESPRQRSAGNRKSPAADEDDTVDTNGRDTSRSPVARPVSDVKGSVQEDETPRSPRLASPGPRSQSQKSQTTDARLASPVTENGNKTNNDGDRDNDESKEAAVKIQSAYRGYRTRKQLKAD